MQAFCTFLCNFMHFEIRSYMLFVMQNIYPSPIFDSKTTLDQHPDEQVVSN